MDVSLLLVSTLYSLLSTTLIYALLSDKSLSLSYVTITNTSANIHLSNFSAA